MDAAALTAAAALVAAIVWLTLEVRRLHASLVPAIRVSRSTLVQTLAEL